MIQFKLSKSLVFFLSSVLVFLLGYFLLNHRGHVLLGFHLNPPQRAFYYWRTQWTPTPEVLTHLEKNEITQLYMRFFDVEWNSSSRNTRPVAPLEFLAPLPAKVEIIPVVYLTNEVFLRTPYAEVEDLAKKVWKKVTLMAQGQQLSLRQLQIDCDWTDRSRRSYFHFIELLHQKLGAEKLHLSTTIRLHQIKYAKRTGIPPADSGMLMFYNFGRIKADSPKSSIFNPEDAKRYTSYISDYRLPLDIVLPIFSWVVHSRDGKVISLLDNLDTKALETVEGFEKKSALKYTATKSFFYHGKYFVKDDLLLVEETSPEVTEEAADLAIQGATWKKSYKTVAFFDMDERNLIRYGNNEIQKIFKQF